MALSCSKKTIDILRGITSKHQFEFYCLNRLHSFATENKLKSYKNVCKNKGFGDVIMPSEDTRILKSNQYQKSNKILFVIYADLGFLIEKTDECKNNPEHSSTIKVSERIPPGFSMSAISSFKSIKNKHDVYGRKD